MKKIVLFSMGLLACLAFSPQRAFAAPDTGPKVDNVEVVDNTSASADQIMPEQGVSQVSITDNYSAFAQEAVGQETVVHRSDHTGGSTNYLLNYMVNSKNNVNSTDLAAVDDRQRSCSCMIMNVNYNDLDLSKNSTGLAALMATAPANLRHSVAWVTSYRSGSELRC
jgi:hypothetical protein